MKTVTLNYDSVPCSFSIPDDLAEVLHHLSTVKRGRFGVITDHLSGVDDPKCIAPTRSDITFLTNPRYDRWLERMSVAVNAIEFLPFVNGLNKEAFDEIKTKAKGDIEDLFNEAKEAILESLKKSQDGESDDGYRLGHRLCYATFTDGEIYVRCHLVTEDDGTGHKRPITNDAGMMIVDSIILPFFTVHRKIYEKGEWKPTNSRALTLMKDAIKKATGIPEWKTISLGKGNFRSMTTDKQKVYGLVSETLKNTSVEKANFFSYLADFKSSFLSAIEELVEKVFANK